MQIYEDKIQTHRRVRQSNDISFVDRSSYLWIQPGAKNFKNIYSGDFITYKDRLCQGFAPVPQFARYDRVKNVAVGKVVNLFQIIKEMQSLDLKERFEEIRKAKQAGNEELKSKLKEQLPYFTHTGIFIPRRNDGLKLPGFTYQLDIDNINNADEILQRIIVDPELYVLFASKSVSGNGVKAVLFLKELLFLQDTWHFEEYRKVYHQVTSILSTYFKSKHNVTIDSQMKAISQPFYMFYSPDMYINKMYYQWVS